MGRFFIFISLFLVACGPKQYKKVAFKPGDFYSICMEGEGSGRFKAWSDNYRFNYTGLVEDGSWLLGLRFPLHGEEVLQIPLKKGTAFSGDFYLRVESAFYSYSKKNKDYTFAQFESFMKSLAMLIRQIVTKRDTLQKCELAGSTECRFTIGKHQFNAAKNKAGIIITHQLDKTFFLKLFSRDLKKSLYQRNIFELKRYGQRSNEFDIRLELSHNDCVRPQ